MTVYIKDNGEVIRLSQLNIILFHARLGDSGYLLTAQSKEKAINKLLRGKYIKQEDIALLVVNVANFGANNVISY